MKEYTISEEDRLMLDEISSDMEREEERVFLNDKRLLKSIGSVMGNEFIEELEEYIEECGYTSEYAIVGEPKGDYQDEDEYPLIKGCWVDQWRNGGYEGDNFAGDVYIKLPSKKSRDRYLKIPYNL